MERQIITVTKLKATGIVILSQELLEFEISSLQNAAEHGLE